MEKSLKEKLEEAQKSVEGLNEPFKTMAFEKILNQLINGAKTDPKKSSAKPQNKIKKQNKKGDKKRIDEETQEIISSLNRNEYPLIKYLEKSMDLSLYLLMEMQKRGYDGLSPSQISEILNSVFRKNVKQPAIAMSLLKADEYTHRIPFIYQGGQSFKYKLMEKGEEYVKKIIGDIQRNSEAGSRNPKE